MTKIAILGGGPSGLMTAYLLEEKYKDSCQTTLFEASDRTGGKILTTQFDSAPVIYEAGVAEFYAYGMIRPDPLRQLIKKLGLKAVSMEGQTVVLDGRILRNKREIRRLCGEATLRGIEEFRKRSAETLSLDTWYEGYWRADNKHPWSRRSCEEILEQVADPTARKYLKVAAHSDLATEPHLTNGLNGLKNFLMDVPGYIKLYSVEGGTEMLAQRLKEQLTRTQIELNCPVVRVEKNQDETYRVHYRHDRKVEHEDFDVVFVALPHNWLTSVEWGGERLRRAMTQHIAYYDRPGHYVRVSALFKKPFWRRLITGSWFMLDAFGGCCVYDEGAQHDIGKYGVLGWLLAGTDALSMSSFDDQTLIEKVLDSLPDALHDEARELFVEAKVHRWLASVNAQPGGLPVRDTRSRHLPEPNEHPALFIVGDYLFDSTLNGVLNSADFATDVFHSWMLKQRLLSITATVHAHNYQPGNGHHAVSDAGIEERRHLYPGKNSYNLVRPNDHDRQAASLLKKSKLGRSYFDLYHDSSSYEDSYHEYFDARYVHDLIGIVWKSEPPYRLLDAGSANGLTLADFAECGIEAWGVEKNKYIYSRTPRKLRKRNLLCDVRKLAFPDNYFDFVYETCLAYLPESHLGRAIKELHRVTRRGVIFGSITSDMNPELFKRRNLLWGMKTLMTLWEWGDLFMDNGFKMEVNDEKTLARLWRCEKKYDNDDDDWYPDDESLLYCFYTKVPDDDSE